MPSLIGDCSLDTHQLFREFSSMSFVCVGRQRDLMTADCGLAAGIAWGSGATVTRDLRREHVKVTVIYEM